MQPRKGDEDKDALLKLPPEETGPKSPDFGELSRAVSAVHPPRGTLAVVTKKRTKKRG